MIDEPFSGHCPTCGQTDHGWRSIETAPKDGTAILIWQPDKSRFDDKPRSGVQDDNRYAIGYWRCEESSSKGSWGNRNSAEVHPTHWMPLPPPPSNSEGRE